MLCRQELVSGKALPTQEELQEWHDSHGQGHHDDAGGAGTKGVPYYYLTVLCNQVGRTQQATQLLLRAHSSSSSSSRQQPTHHTAPQHTTPHREEGAAGVSTHSS